jgi:hypothetical protein
MDGKANANRDWSNRIDEIVATLKRKVTQPGFTGCVSLEIHGADGQIKKAIDGEQKHHSLARQS